MRRALRLLAALALMAFLPAQAAAQGADEEIFQIGLSTEIITVGTSFAGARLVVFGALDNADQRVLRQGRYDIAVVLEGPRRSLVVRERDRFLGLWINRDSQRFADVPASYSVASTRPLRDIAPRPVLRQLLLGAANQPFQPSDEEAASRPQQNEFAAALRRLRAQSGLYVETSGTVEFVSSTLFRANLVLPPDLPVGRHVVRAYLFREGTFLRSQTEELRVTKSGIENQISVYAANSGLAYGLFSVILAFFVGWFGRILFKRD